MKVLRVILMFLLSGVCLLSAQTISLNPVSQEVATQYATLDDTFLGYEILRITSEGQANEYKTLRYQDKSIDLLTNPYLTLPTALDNKVSCKSHPDSRAGYTLVIAENYVSGFIRLNGRKYICLLYTSPSPRDRQKSRMPSSA